jgi:hypothetical protein
LRLPVAARSQCARPGVRVCDPTARALEMSATHGRSATSRIGRVGAGRWRRAGKSTASIWSSAACNLVRLRLRDATVAQRHLLLHLRASGAVLRRCREVRSPNRVRYASTNSRSRVREVDRNGRRQLNTVAAAAAGVRFCTLRPWRRRLLLRNESTRSVTRPADTVPSSTGVCFCHAGT